MGSDVLLATHDGNAKDAIRAYPAHDWTETVVITAVEQVRGLTVLDVYITADADGVLSDEDRAYLAAYQAQTSPRGSWTELP